MSATVQIESQFRHLRSSDVIEERQIRRTLFTGDRTTGKRLTLLDFPNSAC